MSRITSILIATVLVAFAMTACAAPPTPENAESTVVARVGDLEITEDDLEAEAGPVLMPLRQQMYDAKMRVLEAKIFDLLTEKAAQDADVPREQWLAENLAVVAQGLAMAHPIATNAPRGLKLRAAELLAGDI